MIIFLFYSCNKHFNIKLENHDYIQINNLIYEIQENAKNNNINYFRNAVGNPFEYVFDIENIEYSNNLREYFNKEHYSDEEFIEYLIVNEIQSLINSINKADIIQTYRKRAKYSNNGINFNYHWTDKNVHFQMLIIKYDKYISSKLNITYDDTQNWKLISLTHCR